MTPGIFREYDIRGVVGEDITEADAVSIGMGYGTLLKSHGNKKITVAKTLKYFDDLLDQYNFFRTHQSHLINLSFIDKYVKGKGGYVLMSDGTHIEVAVRRKEDFMNKLSSIY